MRAVPLMPAMLLSSVAEGWHERKYNRDHSNHGQATLIVPRSNFYWNVAGSSSIVCLVQPNRETPAALVTQGDQVDFSMPEGLRLLLLSHECASGNGNLLA